ncbi:type II toxin-antitoxin system RelE/ParE family toxin [Rhizobium tubonense]|uniref:Toxin n=1 Tax=Rhizobium tubonense TaxID=484088 RepID=A0A2W4CQ02_9HYPH|nr:type II toxin-antitoxin system RelE/ParE family toxin [Rhizobium tubonense]PZM13008.1 plasmid stabilization protein [Rhizobium tubonense]
MSRYRITPRALRDLMEIGRYTEAAWGRKKRDDYLRKLESRFAWLAEQPSLGKKRFDIQEGYFCFPEGQHLIFYLIAPGEIHIIGVPHQTMDIPGFFDIAP